MKILRIVFTFIFILGISTPSFANNLCSNLFSLSYSPAFPSDAATASRVRFEIENAKRASRLFMKALKRKSDILKRNFYKKIIDLEMVCIGAGPQCASASLVLGRAGRAAIVIEKTEHIAKTFAEKDFIINSVETGTLSMHEFPGGVGSLANYSSSKYAHSSQLAAYIQGQQSHSKIPVLLGTTVTSIREINIDGKTLVEIKTDQNITFRTPRLILGTGIGEVASKIPDNNYVMEFNKNHLMHLENPAKILPIMCTDTLLVSLKINAKKNKTVTLPKEVIIIGDGDGSRIAVEGLIDAHVNLPQGFKLTWVGNDFRTAVEYVASRGGGDRYIHKIVPLYENNQIEGTNGKAEKVDFLENGRMRVTVYNKEKNTRVTVEGDMIIDTTGAQSVSGMLIQSAGEVRLVDVKGELKEMNLDSTVLGRQYVTELGRPLPIYAVGPTAGALATKEELVNSQNQNPVAIFNTVGRTSALISNLLGVPHLPSNRGARKERPPVQNAEDIVRQINK